jgi:hypothetical protein
MQNLVNLLEPELISILDSELAAGNRITQADRVWPRPGSICVTLSEMFMSPHAVDGKIVTFVEDKDPHGPVAEYVFVSSGNSILCSLHRVRS